MAGWAGREVYWCLVFEVVRVVDAEVCKEVIDFGIGEGYTL